MRRVTTRVRTATPPRKPDLSAANRRAVSPSWFFAHPAILCLRRNPRAARRAVLGFKGGSVSIAARAGPAPAAPSPPPSFQVEGRSALAQPPRPAAAAPPAPQAPAPQPPAADAAAPELLALGSALGAPRMSSGGSGRAARSETAERADGAPNEAAAAGEPPAAPAAEGAASAATPAASFYRQQTRCARAAPAPRTRPRRDSIGSPADMSRLRATLHVMLACILALGRGIHISLSLPYPNPRV
jgi:hypothetical protein